jgi:predicted Zn-dependent protease
MLGPRYSRYVFLLSSVIVCFFFSSSLCGRPADHAVAADSYVNGNHLYDENRFTEAVAAYQQAISQDPQFAEAYHNLALAEEMVDRQKAMQDWQRFIDVGAQKSELKFDVARAQARLQLEKDMPALPDAMQPSHYVSGAGDYYWQIAEDSDGNQWKNFPVSVYLGAAPAAKWIEGTRDAFNIWKAMIPMQLVADQDSADIRVLWDVSPEESGHIGEESDWVKMVRVGNQTVTRRVCNITVDWQMRNWTKDEMQAIILHEMGHALGINGHSDSTKDIMYFQMQDKKHQVYVPRSPMPVFWRSLVKQPSQRDINTLIRLYNSPGLGKRLP